MSGQRTRPEPRRFRMLSLALIAILTLAGMATAAAPRNAGAATFSTGDTVFVNTDGLNVRSAAGTSASVATVLANGTTATVTGGPQDADGYTWYQLDLGNGTTGWAASDFLALVAAQDPGFAAGDRVAVKGSLNLRDNAGLSANILAVMTDGSTATVVSGPVSADGIPWYQLNTDSYGQGWAAAGFLASSTSSASSASTSGNATTSGNTTSGNATTGAFAANAALIVKTGDGSHLNLRQDPSINGTLIGKLADGSHVVVLDGPTSADGYDWYHLSTDIGTGWAAGQYLVTPAEGIAVGASVAVADGPLNLRDNASLSANVVGSLPNGTVLDVTDGPTSADGYTWFKVSNTTYGTGWVAGEFLALNTGSGTPSATLSTAAETATVTATATATATGTTA